MGRLAWKEILSKPLRICKQTVGIYLVDEVVIEYSGMIPYINDLFINFTMCPRHHSAMPIHLPYLQPTGPTSNPAPAADTLPATPTPPPTPTPVSPLCNPVK